MDRKLILGIVQDWGIALVIVVAVLVVWGALHPTPPRTGPAPDFVVTAMDGQPTKLSELPGDVVIVNFWATWCGPCRAEIPELSAFAAAHPDVTLVGVSIDEGVSLDRLAVMAKKYGITYPVFLDETEMAADRYGVSGIPVTFVLNGKHEIVDVIGGATTQRALEASLQKARQ